MTPTSTTDEERPQAQTDERVEHESPPCPLVACDGDLDASDPESPRISYDEWIGGDHWIARAGARTAAVPARSAVDESSDQPR